MKRSKCVYIYKWYKFSTKNLEYTPQSLPASSLLNSIKLEILVHHKCFYRHLSIFIEICYSFNLFLFFKCPFFELLNFSKYQFRGRKRSQETISSPTYIIESYWRQIKWLFSYFIYVPITPACLYFWLNVLVTLLMINLNNTFNFHF